MRVPSFDRGNALRRGVAVATLAALAACAWRIAIDGPAATAWIAIAALALNLALAGRPAPAPVRGVAVRSDPVTGLLDRRAFGEEGEALLRVASRRGRAAALIAIAIDAETDEDAALAAAADIVRRALPSGAIAARPDAESIAILLACDARHAGTIDDLAQFLLGALAQPIVARGATLRLRAAIGIAATARDCVTVSALLRRAGIAARAAKTAGRHRALRFDAEMARDLDRRAAVAAALREGIPAGRFAPRYRPHITGADDRLAAIAVHVHDEGATPIADVSHEADGCGMAAELSAAIMRRAFAEARDWDAALALSFPLARAQLDDPWLAQKIVKLLVETGFPASRLEIAIDEAALASADARATLASLANQGVRLALVGLGGPGSSLAALRELPFARLETAALGEPAVIAGLIGLGASIGLPVAAPGETDTMTVGATRRLLAERGLLPAARRSAEQPIEQPSVALRRAG